MKSLAFHLGQPVYVAETDGIRITVTTQNACVMPYFRMAGEREVCPYWLAPWWNDRLYDDGSTISSTLRGNFFCASRENEELPEHGWCANTPWELCQTDMADRGLRMKLRCENPAEGSSIVKTLRADRNSSTIYEADDMTGFEGRFYYNTHPCLKLPIACFAGQLEASFDTCVSWADIAPTEGGSYRRLPACCRIEDLHHATTIYGEPADLTRHPQRKGTLDLLLAKTNAADGVGYAVFANPEEGYIYYQLKDARTLPYTMLWLFNGGRHYPPWNGTLDGCLGVEEMSGPIPIFDERFGKEEMPAYGRVFRPEETLSVRQAYGVVPMPAGFERIEGVELRAEGLHIALGGAAAMDIPVDLTFLRN